MHIIFWGTAAIALAIALVVLTGQDPGYVLIAYANTSVEMSLWFAACAVLLFSALCYFALRGLAAFRQAGKTVRRWWDTQSFQRQEDSISDGLLLFIEGSWQQAARRLRRKVPSPQNRMVRYIFAAHACAELQQWEESERLLRTAEQSAGQINVPILLARAAVQRKRGKRELYLATLVQAYGAAPQNPVVITRLIDLYEELKDWENLAKMAPATEYLRPEHGLVSCQCRTSRALFEHALRAGNGASVTQEGVALRSAEEHTPGSESFPGGGENPKPELPAPNGQAEHGDGRTIAASQEAPAAAAQGKQWSLAPLRKQWARCPSAVTRAPEVVSSYVRVLQHHGDTGEAEQLLKHTLRKNWDARLVSLYGILRGRDAQEQMHTAESWLRAHPHDPDLLLALGRISLVNSLWNEARQYFQKSLQRRETPETYAEIGRLLTSMEQPEAGMEYFRRGLMMSLPLLPDMPLPASAAEQALQHGA